MAESAQPKKVELCVFCTRQPVDPAWRPFCSERCKVQDLARWADESYRVPGDPIDNPEKATDPDG
jgi:endogenous inhibitor of DNA gyrase (YacG/DUF329 family)